MCWQTCCPGRLFKIKFITNDRRGMNLTHLTIVYIDEMFPRLLLYQ